MRTAPGSATEAQIATVEALASSLSMAHKRNADKVAAGAVGLSSIHCKTWQTAFDEALARDPLEVVADIPKRSAQELQQKILELRSHQRALARRSWK